MTLRSAYIGHAPSRDSCEIRGTLEKRDACAIYRRNGRTIAVATIGRDRLSLTSRPPWSKGTQPLSNPFCGINKIKSRHVYGALQAFTHGTWQNLPFATVTVKTQRVGNFESLGA